jgi:hypothetical protein
MIYKSFGDFTCSKKRHILGGQKSANKPSKPKNGIWGKNQYGSVTYPLIGNFTWSKKKYTFGGQKGKTKSIQIP